MAWGWTARAVRRFDPAIGVSLPSWLSTFGWAIFAVGLALLVLCVLVLPLRGLGTPAPFDGPRVLIVSGPYRVVRNPVYVSGIVVLVGYGLAVSSASVLLLAAGARLLTHLLVVFYEEPRLRRVFGESYERYLGDVNRWLPRRPWPLS
jgi:protein-S-isoprenylcysteine O-methyltransferase Ste14